MHGEYEGDATLRVRQKRQLFSREGAKQRRMRGLCAFATCNGNGNGNGNRNRNSPHTEPRIHGDTATAVGTASRERSSHSRSYLLSTPTITGG